MTDEIIKDLEDDHEKYAGREVEDPWEVSDDGVGLDKGPDDGQG